MLPDETFAPCRPTAYVWVRVRLCFHPRPLGAPPFLRAVRRAYMEPSRWRLKVSPTWKGGGQPRWTFRQGVPPLRAGRMRTPPAYHLSRRSLGEDGTTLVTSNHCTPIAFIPHFFGTHVRSEHRGRQKATFLMEWGILERLAGDSMRPFLANFHQKFTQK